MEKTLKLKNSSVEATQSKQHPNFARIAIVFFLSALLAAIAVGKWTRPSLPKPELIPPRALNVSFPPEAHRAVKAQAASPHTVSSDTGASRAKFLACRLELEAKRMRPRGQPLFPACTRAFSQTRDCGAVKREFLEAMYLYAYAYATDFPIEAKIILRETIPLLAGCEENLPLRKRALELDRELSRRRVTKIR